MDKANNSLFIGKEYLSMDGRDIKHIALIKTFGRLNINKTKEESMEFIGLDLETNHLTGELKLLGFWEDDSYSWYTSDFLAVLYNYVRRSIYDNKHIVWWSRLDPFIIFKQFLIASKKPDAINRALNHFGKIGGEWDKKNLIWKVKPVISVMIDKHEFGIMSSIRSSILFYIKDGEEVKQTWAYDIKQMYESGLEKESKSRFDWYSKIDESAHLVDWDRFNTDDHYRKAIVLKSNMFDARAVHDLAHETMNQFQKAFGKYPKTLVSQGSLARTALIAQMDNMGLDVGEHAKRIGIVNHLDSIVEQLGPKKAKDFFCLMTETYSAGYIEGIRFGYAKEGGYADIASAYPGIIVSLLDLEGATYLSGKGNPKRAKKGYTFVRGTISVPKGVDFNPITVKHPVHNSTNIRATGTYRASYIIEERDFMLKQGATFKDEEWVMIETKGELSPLAKVAQSFIQLRKDLLAKGDSAQYMAKISSNSLYGILFEAVDSYEEIIKKKQEVEIVEDSFYKDILKDYRKKIDFTGLESEIKKYFDTDYHKIRSMWNGKTGISPDIVKQELESKGIFIEEDHAVDILYKINELYRMNTKSKVVHEWEEETVIKGGYRSGEFFNPVFASYITAMTRIKLASASQEIENRGGKVVSLMTDSITWEGSPDLLPQEYWKEEKTLGYFEKPEKITDIISLGSGRYGFKNEKGYQTTKSRGISSYEQIDWYDLIAKAGESKNNKVRMNTKSLVSVGLVLGNHEYTYLDLGRVIETERDIDLVVGLTKRPLKQDLDLSKFSHSLIDTESFHIPDGMLGENDLTLPDLRNKMSKRPYKTRKVKRREISRETSKRYRTKNKDQIRAYDKERKRKARSRT